jgi:hypothetical protein
MAALEPARPELLEARLRAAGLPVPAEGDPALDRLALDLALHLDRQDVLREATAGLGPGDPPAGPGEANRARRRPWH